MWWTCDRVVHIWNYAFDLISIIRNTHTPPCPAIALLDIYTRGFSENEKWLISRLCAVVRMTIAKQWKSASQFNRDSIIESMNECHRYEMYMWEQGIIRGKQFKHNWRRWLILNI
ncbi:hypothetical protein GDO81_001878 [Engystomops pustulosus]|uniref:Uncharacterized protein n=1 Tax=Engystomops pustulosus TaxID=76066 RepID=A0AAV7DFY0_ENGPU|nr:hypothetical protein GDO81_001878 [Engystomops pustulosus]